MTDTEWTGGAGAALPDDADAAALAGRAFVPGLGPRVVTVRGGVVFDVGASFRTMRELTEHPEPAEALRKEHGQAIGTLPELLARTAAREASADRLRLLAPVDLHVVKAAGVTFAASMLERVIEERAGGDVSQAAHIRSRITEVIGDELASLVPGSDAAARLKEHLVASGMWSQYLEVGIGPDAEIFTKAPVLSAVGTATEVGVLAASAWNNPEPEMVVVVASTGRIVGATLGNDINLRDVEGRSALLLGRAKDNNASTAIGPFIRLFDAGFDLDDVRSARIGLRVEGADGFVLDDMCDLRDISRDPADLVAQAHGDHHQYPDGFVLFLGTPFAPIQDRDAPGRGFTHHIGDVVRISSPRIGTLVNRVDHSEAIRPWTYGIADLFADLTRSTADAVGTATVLEQVA